MRAAGALGVAAAIVLSVALGAAPAAARDEVGLSIDGRHWSSDLSRPLLDPGFRWVPGDRQMASFYVRNQGLTGAHLTIAVESRDPDRLLADHDVALRARVAPGRWRSLDNGQDAVSLLDGALARSGTVRVDVRVRFRWSSGNTAQVDHLPLDFVVRLTQADLGGGTASEGDGFLPGTGSVVESWLVLLGAALLVSGGALVVAHRRRELAHG